MASTFILSAPKVSRRRINTQCRRGSAARGHEHRSDAGSASSVSRRLAEPPRRKPSRPIHDSGSDTGMTDNRSISTISRPHRHRRAEDVTSEATSSHVRIHDDLIQGGDEWLAQRCEQLTASEVEADHHRLSRVADNENPPARLRTALPAPHLASSKTAVRVRRHAAGRADEIYPRRHENTTRAGSRTGFITNNRWGFTIGYSPDGLVGDDGLIECSRAPASTRSDHRRG